MSRPPRPKRHARADRPRLQARGDCSRRRTRGRLLLVGLVMGTVAACGGTPDTIETDLAAAIEVIDVPVDLLEPTQRDRYGFTNPTSEASLDVFEVPTDQTTRTGTFGDPPATDVLRFVRNPVLRGAVGNILDVSETVTVIVIPLIEPTRDFGVDFDALFIGLDPSGEVTVADFSDESVRRLDQLFELGRDRSQTPGEMLALAAGGINSESPSAEEAEAASIVIGGG